MTREDLPILNLSNPGHRKVLKGYIDGLTGLHRVKITKCRDQRTLSQNAYLHGVVFPVVAMGLSEAWGETVTPAEAKAFLKDKFLRRERVKWDTGELLGYETRSTADLDVAECSEFIEKIRRFAQDELGCPVPDAGEYENAGEPALKEQ